MSFNEVGFSPSRRLFSRIRSGCAVQQRPKDERPRFTERMGGELWGRGGQAQKEGIHTAMIEGSQQTDDIACQSSVSRRAFISGLGIVGTCPDLRPAGKDRGNRGHWTQGEGGDRVSEGQWQSSAV